MKSGSKVDAAYEIASLVHACAQQHGIAETVHPHPTLSETMMECADLFFGHATHAYVRKKTAE